MGRVATITPGQSSYKPPVIPPVSPIASTIPKSWTPQVPNATPKTNWTPPVATPAPVPVATSPVNTTPSYTPNTFDYSAMWGGVAPTAASVNAMNAGTMRNAISTAVNTFNKAGVPATSQPQQKATSKTKPPLPSWAQALGATDANFAQGENGEWFIEVLDGRIFDMQMQEVETEATDVNPGQPTRFTDPESGITYYITGYDSYGQPTWAIANKAKEQPAEESPYAMGVDPKTGKQGFGKYMPVGDTMQWVPGSFTQTEADAGPMMATGTNPATGEQGYGTYSPYGDTLQWDTFQSTEPTHTEVRNVNGRNIAVTVSDRTGQVIEYGQDYGEGAKNVPLPEGFPESYQDQQTGYTMTWSPTEGGYTQTGSISGWMDPELQWQQNQWQMEHPNVGTIGSWLPSGGQEPSRQDYDSWPTDRQQAFANSIASGMIKPPFWWNSRGSSGGSQTYSRTPAWTGGGFRQY